MLLDPDDLNQEVQRSSPRLFKLMAKSVQDIERKTGTPKSTVHDILTRSGLVARRPHIVPHDLTAAEQNTRVKVSLYRMTAWTETIVGKG
ncbi:unnamed protein product [Heligmosomoides polygyrus]|uniref:HTH iclR-type domain-containing protein n=1 Tax=Heligmosomoides polygyrus TaxID=6339 RepID=A0A183GI70_HELPZ|nr:unnamed protein product [Heligmosomoides polygyrus]